MNYYWQDQKQPRDRSRVSKKGQPVRVFRFPKYFTMFHKYTTWWSIIVSTSILPSVLIIVFESGTI